LLSDYRARRHCRAPVKGGYAPDAAPLDDEVNELS
jgi:hypothetical protein